MTIADFEVIGILEYERKISLRSIRRCSTRGRVCDLSVTHTRMFTRLSALGSAEPAVGRVWGGGNRASRVGRVGWEVGGGRWEDRAPISLYIALRIVYFLRSKECLAC